MWAITLPTKIKKTFKSIRFRFILAYLLILTVAFAALGVAALQPVGEHLYTKKGEQALDSLKRISPDVAASLDKGDYSSVYDLLVKSANETGGRYILTDENGIVQMDSASFLNGRAISGLDGSVEPEGKHSIEKASKLGEAAALSNAKRVAVASLSISGGSRLISIIGADDVLRDVESIFKKLAVALIAVLVVVLLLGFIITRSYTRPLDELSAAISHLSSGDFSVRVSEEGHNELTDLSRAFNEMTGRMEMLDRSRNQFVSNASHELKTPLATIKIMVQTLLYQEVYDEGMSKEFLTDVDKEVDRLAAVVSDLLTLVGMDSGESKLNMEELSVTDMVSEDVKRLSPLARERGVELEYNASQSLEVYGDRIKLDQVFYNLIDNAIKYTPRGEGVKVEVTRQNKNAVIKVKDNGIGIPEADIKHIFDRFYRVDKARSRETGGTGLGLSIAKQIILAHNGNISVSSKPDMGSTFTVTLPLGGKSSARQVSQ